MERVLGIAGWGFSEAALAPLSEILLRPITARSVQQYFTAEEPLLELDRELVNCGTGAEPLHIVAWSLGAMLTLDYVLQFPSNARKYISSMTLLAACGRFTRGAGQREGIAPRIISSMKQGIYDNPQMVLSQFAQAMHPKAREYLDIEHSSETCDSSKRVSLLRGLTYLEHYDVRADLGSIQIPTLVMHGCRDTIVPVALGRALAQGIPGAKYVEIDDANHYFLCEEYRESLNLITAFIQDNEVTA